MPEQSLNPLLNVSGVSESTLEHLREAGFDTPKEVGLSTRDDLRSIEGINISTAAKILRFLEREGHREPQEITKNQRQLQNLLRDLFQFDASDLDFGIYRILNQRRDIIEDFIEEDLILTVREALEVIATEERAEIEKELEQARAEVVEQLNEEVFTEEEDIKEEFRDFGVAEDYLEAKERLNQYEIAEETEARIFNDLYKFFSRFYERGDFHAKRRFSSQNSKFMIPYNGEEVFLHWANRNQYYVKTSEHFNTYRFQANGFDVEFRVEDANVPQDNIKGDERFFVPGHNPVRWDKDEDRDLLIVTFQYRLITEEEAEKFVEIYNEVTGEDRTSFTHKTNTILCTALYKQILDELDARGPRDTLQSEEDGETVLMRHLTRYTSKNKMDYFIHKNLGGFLRDELDYYIQNEILDTKELVEADTDRDPHSLLRARVVRKIATRIITFLDQIESFQKRLFEKRKFVTQTDYMITLDKVHERFYDDILNNEDQLEQWREVYNTDEWEGSLSWQGEFTEVVLEDNPHLMIDTALFDDTFKHELLASFEDIEEATDGTLFHGENFQALNLLLEKYRNSVDCCYIDPPYNTGSREFLYKDKYRHSSWISMMEDRLSINKEFLADSGLFFTTIDSNEAGHLRLLTDKIFGEHNFLADISWEKRYTRNNKANLFYSLKDNILTYRASESVDKVREPRTEKAKGNYRNPDNDPRGPWIDSSYVAPTSHEERPKCVYEIENPHTGETITHPSRAWKFKPEVHEQHVEEDRLYWGEDGDFEYPRLKNFLSEMDGMVPVDLWGYEESGTNDEGGNQIKNMFGYEAFDNPKPSKLIRRMIQHTPSRAEGGVILDFFAGSGSTAQAVIEENKQDNADRDYILVELDSHFDEVLRPRIQKYVFSEEWNEGIPESRDGQSHMVKYHRIESYEDALNNVVIEEPEDEQQRIITEQREEYVSGYMLDFEAEGPSLLDPISFEHPFDYELAIEKNGTSRAPTKVDLVETFHYLFGGRLHEYQMYEHQDRQYVVTRCSVEMENSIDNVLTVWRDADNLDLEQEREWFEEQFEPGEFDRIYINTESFVPDAEPVEITFKQRMEAGHDGAE